jgi:uncharacterized RDD family membrane protein YckC
MDGAAPHRLYVGFWNRTAAALIDSALLLLVLLPVQQIFSDRELLSLSESPTGLWDVMSGYVLPALAILVFWKYRSATPGKMFMAAEIVDANSGGRPSTRQLVLRYVGYYLATIPLLLGLVWVAFDGRKQGWHDKLAGTLVVSTRPGLGLSKPGRYAHTSPWTVVLCALALVLIAMALLVAASSVFSSGGLRPAAEILGQALR